MTNTIQDDLFGSRDNALPVKGLAFQPEVISPEEERSLIEAIRNLNLQNFAFQQWISKRRTGSFGWQYDFTNGKFGETDPLPDFVLSVRDKMAAFGDVEPASLVQASIIEYSDGAGIGWHVDRPELDAVIGISLGSETTMRFRKRTAEGFQRASIVLPPRSCYLLAGEVRYDWEHSISPGGPQRWSITLRALSPAGKAKYLKDVEGG